MLERMSHQNQPIATEAMNDLNILMAHTDWTPDLPSIDQTMNSGVIWS
jgi:hypothetical protein